MLGWFVIGLAAAYMSWALPFRRGIAGIIVNALAALTGAIGLPLLAIAVGWVRSPRDAMGYVFSALGALVLLGVLHAVWERATRKARHADR